MTQMQMLEAIRAFDRQLHSAAQPLTPADTAPVLAALEEDPFAGNIATRLSGRYPSCAPTAALRILTLSRSAERRVGKECARTCRSRWSAYHSKQNTQ